MPLPTYAKPMPKFKKKDQKVGTTKNSIILCLFCPFFFVFIVFYLFLLQMFNFFLFFKFFFYFLLKIFVFSSDSWKKSKFNTKNPGSLPQNPKIVQLNAIPPTNFNTNYFFSSFHLLSLTT
jgi:hypothetical protein